MAFRATSGSEGFGDRAAGGFGGSAPAPTIDDMMNVVRDAVVRNGGSMSLSMAIESFVYLPGAFGTGRAYGSMRDFMVRFSEGRFDVMHNSVLAPCTVATAERGRVLTSLPYEVLVEGAHAVLTRFAPRAIRMPILVAAMATDLKCVRERGAIRTYMLRSILALDARFKFSGTYGSEHVSLVAV